MLVDFQYIPNTKKLVVSYVDKDGKIKLKYYDFKNPMKYVVCDEYDPEKSDRYRSYDGKPVKLVETDNPDRYTIYEFLDSLPEKDKKEIFEFNLPKIYFIDIETEIIDGFPDPKEANSKILSISIVYDDKIVILGLKELSKESQYRIINNTNKYFEKFNKTYKFKYVKYDDEFDMIYSFFNEMIPEMPLLTGWNFLKFDWVYLVNRAKKLSKLINGKEYKIDPSVSSLTKKLTKIWGTDIEVPSHRMIFDYMQLYEILDTSVKVKESSSLDFVANKLVGVEKIKYVKSIYKLKEDASIKGYEFKKGDICRNNGDTYYMYKGLDKIELTKEEFDKIKDLFYSISINNLQNLYDNDYEYFIYYNTVDSVLVQKIHESRNYISIVFAISELAKIRINDVISHMNNALGSLAITEGVLRERLRNEGIVIFKNNENENLNDEDVISGGWVKQPVVGISKWVTCYDFASLYPRTQMQFYIAPENLVGIQDENNKEYCTNGVKIDLNKHVVCENGVVFEKRKSPTIKMLEDIYNDRKKYKKIMMEKKEEYKKVMDEITKLLSEIDD